MTSGRPPSKKTRFSSASAVRNSSRAVSIPGNVAVSGAPIRLLAAVTPIPSGVMNVARRKMAS